MRLDVPFSSSSAVPCSSSRSQQRGARALCGRARLSDEVAAAVHEAAPEFAGLVESAIGIIGAEHQEERKDTSDHTCRPGRAGRAGAEIEHRSARRLE